MTPCALTQHRLDKDDYGVLRYLGRPVRVHRLAYAAAHGLDVFTMGGVVMHSCDNPRCVNPDHLSLGTHADNVIDKVTKGRQARRVRAGVGAKLSDAQAATIRATYVFNSPEFGSRAIARRFGVSQKAVMNILHNATYT